jgi:signal transduction histidine kinase/ligand-binding sensor domain-containing protein/AraC-like DNA-binding protein
VKGIAYYILCLFLCIQLEVDAKEYIFEQITSNTGITFNAINSVAEDKYGFIWFGCNNGLYYYNSSEILKFNFDRTLPDVPLSSIIRYLYKDKTERLWIGTNNGICYLNEGTNSFSQLNFINANEFGNINATLLHQLNDDTFLAIINGALYKYNLNDLKLESIKIGSQNSSITYFTPDVKGNYYLASNDGLIYKTDSLLTDFEPLYDVSSHSVSTLSYINDELWIGYSDDGVEIISKDGQHIRFLKEELEGKQHIINNRIRRIVKCSNNDVWIGTLEGISVISSENNTDIFPNKQNGLPHKGVFDLFVDRNDGVWVATWSGGLAYYNKFNYKFLHYTNTNANRAEWNSVISSFSEDKKGNIWVGSENNGLYKFYPNKNSYEKIEDSPVQLIKSMVSDKQQRLWIGTFFEGLWLMEDEKLRKIGDVNGIFSTILHTKNGVWAGKRSGGGTVFYDEEKNTFDFYTVNNNDSTSICSNGIWNIFEDSKGNIWFCSDEGISVRYKNNDYFTNYYKNTHGLSSNLNYTFAEDEKGNIWIGSGGSGIDIYDPKTKTFSKFSVNEPIKNADIYCILRDKKDNIWFSSNQGVYAFYHDSQKLKHFTKEDGLLGQQYHPNSGLVSKKGLLFFGGGNGFNIIDPEVVQPNTNNAEIFLSKLTINNLSINQQKPKFINSEYLSSINQIELNYNQNTIGVAFVANSFIKNAESKFRYRLLNYIDEWNFAEYNSNISFTKIPPGDYILQVEYLNNDGLNVAPLKEINLEINPPFWFSWYAYLFYFLLVGTVIFIAVREMRFREKSKASQMLFTEKVKFFTNVSHEFRTPLTLIISPIKSLMNKFANEPVTSDSLQVIHRNADRLLRLTNQILDFRLIELNSVKLKREKTDLISLCKNVYDCFEFQIREKEINCIFNSSFKSFELPVDAEKIEKVVYNILSNALKFSNERGQIILSLEKKTLTKEDYSQIFSVGNNSIGDVLEIKIKDNGKGIKKSILNNIFDRFFMDAENAETGTGIGLHICQEYIKMHKGNIMIESEPGKETTFTINIPIEQEAIFEKQNLIIQKYFDAVPDKSKDAELGSSATGKPIILFAEDNNELRNYYKNLLSTKYKVITAKNGTQAFEIAVELNPDLILSDILMPGMDGMSLTEQIRKTVKINHIPIILLTALRDSKFEIESMHKGANAFLTKPVEDEMLFAKIDSVLSNADVVRNKFKEKVNMGVGASGVSQSFIEKVERIIEKNLQNQTFEITELASQVGISRSSLQRKIKKTVNMSPSEFIREVRLKKAVILLKKDDYNIDEIAIIVGFNSTSYFIRSFKKKYEMTPSAFKQSSEM